jgi:hypothetical protein
MKVIVGGRQTGKTTALIHEMAKHPDMSVMICASRQSADYAERLARNRYPSIAWRGLFVPFSMSGTSVRSYEHVYVDDVDLVLFSVLNTRPEVMSMTAEPFDTDEQERLKLREQLRAQQG